MLLQRGGAMAQAQQQVTGLEGHGIRNVARVFWNLSVPALVRRGGQPTRGQHLGGGAAGLPDGPAHRAFAERQVHRPRALERGQGLVEQGESPDRAGQLRCASPAPAELRGGQGTLRPGLLRGRRPALPPARPDHHRAGVAQPLRAPHVHRGARRRRPPGAHARVHRHRHAGAHRRSRSRTAPTRKCSSC